MTLSLIRKLEELTTPYTVQPEANAYHLAIGDAIAIIRRHYEGRPAIAGKPLELQTRYELLAYIRHIQVSHEIFASAMSYTQRLKVEELEARLSELHQAEQPQDVVMRLTKALNGLLAHDFADACQECGIGQSEAWLEAKAAIAAMEGVEAKSGEARTHSSATGPKGDALAPSASDRPSGYSEQQPEAEMERLAAHKFDTSDYVMLNDGVKRVFCSEISVNEDALQGCIVDEMVGVGGNRVAMATRIINRIRPYLRTPKTDAISDLKGGQIFYPEVAKIFHKWAKTAWENPIIQADVCFETFLAGWQAAMRKHAPGTLDAKACAEAWGLKWK